MNQQWEYKVINTLQEGVPGFNLKERDWAKRLRLGLNQLGKDGWEMCAIQGSCFIFKRPKK